MKCPFCIKPCGNEHCPYYENVEDNCQKEVKGLEEENKRLREAIKQLQEYLVGKK